MRTSDPDPRTRPFLADLAAVIERASADLKLSEEPANFLVVLAARALPADE
jgi:hypothetical protein